MSLQQINERRAIAHLIDLLRIEGLSGSESDVAAAVRRKLRAAGCKASWIRSDDVQRKIPGDFDTGALVEPASQALDEMRKTAEAGVDAAMAGADFDSAVRVLLRLRKPIDSFFDDVMVMVDDPKLKEARLGLLEEVKRLFMRVADFSRVVLKGEEREE